MSFPILGRPRPAFVDSSGAPLSSGTVTVLEPTDDTNKATYPTAADADAGTNANDNPITLNSRGEVPSGFFGVDGEKYKLVLKDSDGATVYTDDGIQLPNSLTAAGIGAALNPQTAEETSAGVTPSSLQFSEEYIQVKRYGAVADGSQDNADADTTAAKNALLVAAQHSGAKVVFEHGNFVIDETLVPDNNKIQLIGDGAILTAGTGIPASGAIITSMADNATNQALLDSIYGSGVVSVRTNVTSSMTWMRIKGFRFAANSNAIKGIHLVGCTVGTAIEDCLFSNFEDASIAMNGCWSFTLSRNDVRGRNGNGVGIDLAKAGNGLNGSTVEVNGFSLRSNHCTSLGEIGIRIGESLGGDIHGNIFEATGAGFIGAVLSQARGINYSGNYHEVAGAGSYALVLGLADGSTSVEGSAIAGNSFQMSTDSEAAILLNAVNTSFIGPNRHGGPTTVMYETPASYAANQVNGNVIYITRDNSTYITETATLDRITNRLISRLTYDSSDREAHEDRFSRVRTRGIYIDAASAQIASDQDNYIADANSSVWRLEATGATRTITGLGVPGGATANEGGKELTIINIGSSQSIVLAHQNASSSESRRIISSTGSNLTLSAGDFAKLWYDVTTQRWRVLSTNGS